MSLRFTNRHEVSLDHKCRCYLPAEICKQIQPEKIYLQEQKPENHLENNTLLYFIYPEQYIKHQWEHIPSPLDQKFDLEQTLEKLQQIHGLRELKLDNQNRINLGITPLPTEKKAYFIGAGEYIILYLGSKETFEKYAPKYTSNNRKEKT